MFVVIILLTILACSNTENIPMAEESDFKRLLLNDQQSIQTLLAQYELKLQSYEKTNLQLQQRITALENDYQSRGSSTYVRWGKKSCATNNQTELVYSGIAGGSYYNYQGSGVDYLCLPHDPDTAIPQSSFHSFSTSDAGLLFGAEYQMNYNKVKYDDNVPCSVCRVPSTVLMIPGKSSCPSGWKVQYKGLLTSQRYDFPGSSQYVCLDADPEYIEGTRARDENGKLFYPVRTRCGSLPCPPYVNDTFVSCAVCSK